MVTRKNISTVLVGLIALMGAAEVAAYGHNNMSFAYDSYLWRPMKLDEAPQMHSADGNVSIKAEKKRRVHYGANLEYGYDMKGIDKDGEEVDGYKLFGPTESSLGMFVGNINAAAVAFVAGMTNPPLLPDNGTLGHVEFDGRRRHSECNVWFSAELPWESMPGTMEFGVYLPIKMVSGDVTYSAVAAPANAPIVTGVVQSQLVNDLGNQANKHGELGIGDFNNDGLGDPVLMLSWSDEYDQLEGGLATVGVFGQVGLSIPYADPRNQDQIFSIPLGNDGSWGLPVSFGMKTMFDNKICLRTAVDVLLLFSEESERRLKVSSGQGEWLLSEKVLAYRKPGTHLRISAGGEIGGMSDVLTLGLMYQGSWRGEDTFSVEDSKYTDSIGGAVNTAARFQESVYHQLMFSGEFDWRELSGMKHAPIIEVFYKYPFVAGKLVNTYKTWGLQLAFSF